MITKVGYHTKTTSLYGKRTRDFKELNAMIYRKHILAQTTNTQNVAASESRKPSSRAMQHCMKENRTIQNKEAEAGLRDKYNLNQSMKTPRTSEQRRDKEMPT